jgi:hypothetical protein
VAKSLYQFVQSVAQIVQPPTMPSFNCQKNKDLHRRWFGLMFAPTLPGKLGPLNMNLPDRVEERKAAALLGLPPMDLRRFSRSTGIGHLEESGHGQEMVFTYEELRRLCLLAAQSSK